MYGALYQFRTLYAVRCAYSLVRVDNKSKCYSGEK